MIRVAIVEDDDGCVRQLRDYIDRFAGETGERLNITVFPDGEEIVDGYRPVWDIILMDIEMPGLNGMEAAGRIREVDPQVLIMFITNMAQYAVKGYEVDAVDYVLKPVSYYAFALKMRKAVRILGERSSGAVLVSVDGEKRRLPVADILYIEVMDHKLIYHTADGDYSVTGSLRELEKGLGDEGFARCSNYYLVNLKHVDSIRQDKVVVGGHELKISRTKKKVFTQRLSEHVLIGGKA